MSSGVGLLAGSALSGGIQGYFGYKAAQEQNKAARRALRQEIDFAREQRDLGLAQIYPYQEAAKAALNQQYAYADQFNRERAATEQQFFDYSQTATKTADRGLRQARSDLGRLTEQFDPNAQNVSARLEDRLANYQLSPAAQFQLEQGEQALGRSAAARGGRLGGAALKELTRFSQGVASQDINRFADREAALLQGEAGRQLSALGSLSDLGSRRAQFLGSLQQTQASGLAGLKQAGSQTALQTGLGIQTGLASALGQFGSQNASIITGGQQPNFALPVGSAGAGTAAIGNAAGDFGSNVLLLNALYGGGGGKQPQSMWV